MEAAAPAIVIPSDVEAGLPLLAASAMRSFAPLLAPFGNERQALSAPGQGTTWPAIISRSRPARLAA